VLKIQLELLFRCLVTVKCDCEVQVVIQMRFLNKKKVSGCRNDVSQYMIMHTKSGWKFVHFHCTTQLLADLEPLLCRRGSNGERALSCP
jgi:hypothetical protein